MLIATFVSQGLRLILGYMSNLPECTDTTSLEDQRSLRQRLPSPAHRKSAQDMTMRNNKHITLVIIRVLETGFLIFTPDLSDQRI